MMSRIVKIAVPDLGDFRDVPIVESPVAVGDIVAAGDTLVVVESDKATLEVAGRIAALHVGMNGKVSEGALLVEIVAEDTGQALSSAVAAAPRAEAGRAESSRCGSTNGGSRCTSGGHRAPGRSGGGAGRVAAPCVTLNSEVRARTGGDLARLSGSGPKGRITREDVQGFVKSALQSHVATASAGGLELDLPDWPRIDFAKFGDIERKPLSRIVRISGPALTRNATMIPHVTNFDEADVTELEAFR